MIRHNATLLVTRHLFDAYGKNILIWLGLLLTAVAHIIYKLVAPIVVVNWIAAFILDGIYPLSGLYSLLITYTSALVSGFLGDYIFIKYSDRRYEELVGMFYDKIVRMPVAFFRKEKAGALSTLFRNHLDGTINVFRILRTDIIPLGVATVGSALVLWYYLPIAACAFTIGVVLRGVVAWMADRKLKPLRKIAHKVYDELSGKVSEQMSQMVVVQAASHIRSERASVVALANEEGKLFWVRHRAAMLFDILGSTIVALCFVGAVSVVVMSDVSLRDGLQVLVLLTVLIFQSMPLVTGVAELHQRLGERWDHVATSLHKLSGPADVSSDKVDNLTPSSGSLEFREVCFAYEREKHIGNVLDNINLSIASGEHVAIIGPNGAGKSTLVNLVLGFEAPQEGRVLVDGESVENYDVDALRKNLSYSPQGLRLFNATVRDNLYYYEPGVSAERAAKVFELTRVNELIRKLPDGLDTVVGESGDELSGGQRQRLLLARVLLRDAKIYILDEPTSAMGGESATKLVASICEFLKGRTLLLVTHSEAVANIFPSAVSVDSGSAKWIRKSS